MLLLVPILFAAQHDMHSMHAGSDPLRSGLGAIHHKVSTRNEMAQRYFDQGLALYFGFNHNASARSFRHAYELDPNFAMAHWGVALALGPNINMDVSPENEKEAYKEILQARTTEGTVTPEEVALIDALASRYSNEDKPDLTKLATAYSLGMADVYHKYPDDPEAGSLYAESLMDLHPWRMWSADGVPAEGTEECINVLHTVLKKYPNHIGANHFLIHSLEASPHPEEALAAAHRLDMLAPQSGHLVHMPSHIYIRTGDYHQGVVANEKALAVDAAFLEKSKDPGVYPMYYMHNFDMLRHAANMEGNFARSQYGADQLAEKAKHMQGMPTPEGIASVPILNELRFRKWDAILARPAFDGDASSTTMIHFARGMAFAAKGQRDQGNNEMQQMLDAEKKIAPETPWIVSFTTMKQVADISNHVLQAKLAANQEDEISHLRAAVQLQDQVGYDEPPDFFYPVRESLGGALLRAGKAAEAEQVFRDDLVRNPGNGRSFFGLAQALKAEGKQAEAAKADRDFRRAWQWADTKLSTDTL